MRQKQVQPASEGSHAVGTTAATAHQAGVDAWQLAVERHLVALPEAQKAAFTASASPDACLNLIIQAQGRKRGFTRLMELMRPLIDPLKRFEGAIDVLIQTHGALLSPIWGPLRMAITMASEHYKTLESLAMILHRITSSLERFQNYETLFKGNQLVQRVIGALYCDLIDFCTRVVRYHTRSSIRTAMVSFEKEFREVSENINFHSEEIDHAANAANIAESKRAREVEELRRHTQLQNDIQRWLSPSNVQDDLFKHDTEYMPGSCDWVLETPQMKRYFSPRASTTMRIQGRPGAGKTIMASCLVNQLNLKGNQCVLYFFCKAGEVDKREITHVYRTLLAQLLHHDPSLYRHIESVYSRSGRATADSFVDVSTCLLLALSNTSQRLVHIIVDALDECEDAGNLLQGLFDVRKHASAEINMIFTSRPIQISYFFDEDVVLGSTATTGPIYQYIDQRVFQMKSLCDSHLSQMIVHQVSREADGLWLYARLMLDEIERLPSAELVRQHLRRVPRGLTQLYTEILRSKESMFTTTDLMFAQQIYLWLDVDDYLPNFLSWRDCLTYDTLTLILQKVNFGQPVFDPIGLVSNLCSPLVQATDSNVDGSVASLRDYQIFSTHYSADQYLSESHGMPYPTLPLVLRPRRLRQLHRGATAVWYFTACQTSQDYLEEYRRNPNDADHGSYFEMAYGIWGALQVHSLPTDLNHEEMAEASGLLRELTRFLDPQAFHCMRWVESAIIVNYAGKWVNLLRNAEKGLAMMRAHWQTTDHSALQAFTLARLTFFHDYVYVLRLTGPGQRVREEQSPPPDGFLARPLAVQMLEVGRRWEYLHSHPLDPAIHRIEQMQEAMRDLTFEEIEALAKGPPET